ncbi:MAG TPA: hypothetical protein DCY07_00650, partial [Rhodospirillaceae bacterium]|nr:hypothetical protein [Rhodospirillaceae bacterium]
NLVSEGNISERLMDSLSAYFFAILMGYFISNLQRTNIRCEMGTILSDVGAFRFERYIPHLICDNFESPQQIRGELY